jgi:hypothetical protein
MLKIQLYIITNINTNTTITTNLGVHSDKCTLMNSSSLFTVQFFKQFSCHTYVILAHC